MIPYTANNLKSYFETATPQQIDTFANEASINYVGAWQSRFDFTGKQIYLTELTLSTSGDRNYFIDILQHLSFSKLNPALRNNVPIDFSGFLLESNNEDAMSLTTTRNRIHTDWVWISVMPYLVLASFWIEKRADK